MQSRHQPMNNIGQSPYAIPHITFCVRVDAFRLYPVIIQAF